MSLAGARGRRTLPPEDRALPRRRSSSQIALLVRALDDDGSGTLSCDELADFVEHGVATMYAAVATLPAVGAAEPAAVLAASHLRTIGVSFRDYSCSMLERLHLTAAHAKSQDYWRKRLQTLPPAPELPKRPPPPQQIKDEGTYAARWLET